MCMPQTHTYVHMHAGKTAQYVWKPETVNYSNETDCLNRRKLNMHIPKSLLSAHQLP
jgi:hypothetical protein